MTFNTGNPVGSTDARDLYDNAQNFDKFSLGQELEYPDRLGVPRKSLAGIRAEATETLSRLGYHVLGDYAAGLVVQNYGQVFRKDGEFYRAAADLALPYPLNGDWVVDEPKFVSVGDGVLRQELAASTGAALTGYRSRDVERRLADTFSVADYGAEIGAMGNSPAADAQGIADSDPAVDTLKYGHLGVAKDVFGIRRNACVLSVRADMQGDGEFDPQVTGVNDTQSLANYNSNDVVGIFSDIVSRPYRSWELVASPSYQEDGFTAAGLDFTEMKIGMVVRTDHAAPWWGIITGFDEAASKVIILEWRTPGGNSPGVPSAGTGLKINPINKQWALNTNLIFMPDSKAKQGVIAEYGIFNQGSDSGAGIFGVDMVLLPDSPYQAESAFLARAPGLAKFIFNFQAQSASVANYYSNSSARGFLSEGDDAESFVSVYLPELAPNKTAYSVRHGGRTGTEAMKIAGDGKVWRMPFRTRPIDADGIVMEVSYFRYLHIGGTVTLHLPPVSETSLQNGDTFEIMKPVSNGAINLQGNGRNIVIPSGSVGAVGLTDPRLYTVCYYDNVWYLA